MNGRITPALLVISLTLCVQGRGAWLQVPGSGPIGLDPVPSLSGTINRGFPIGGAARTTAPPPVMTRPAVAPTQAPSAAPAALAPASLPTGIPATNPAFAAPIAPGMVVHPPAAIAAAPAAGPLVLPPLPPGVSRPVALPPGPAAATAPPGPATRDTPLGPVTTEGKMVGLTVALVGDEPIPLTELQDALRIWQRENVPPGRRLSREELDSIASDLLQHIVDRALIVQEAKRSLLDSEKKLNMFTDFIDKHWKESELPRLMRTWKVESDWELRLAIEKAGLSLERMKQSFRKDALSQEFLREALKGRMSRPELPAMWAYYNEHLAEFDQPAHVTWREILIRFDSKGGRVTAREQAQEIRSRIVKGESFAALAATQSDGPTASEGGLWETEPGASPVAAIDQALATLPLNQPSPVIEGSSGFHIVIVEARRVAGPIAFVDAQDKILATIQEETVRRETGAFLDRLRAETPVITRFEGTSMSGGDAPQDPAATRASGSGP